MHLGNGAITPECAVITWGVAAAGVAWAGRRIVKQPVSSARWLATGTLSAAILAAQMVNAPVLPGVSGHLVGGVLAACLLGPELAVLALASVLAVQALLLGDGGMLAFGANLINMGLLPAVLVAWTRAGAGSFDGSPGAAGRFRGLAHFGLAHLGRVGGVALLAVLGAALLIVLQVALGRSPAELSALPQFAASMLGSHAVIGLSEGLLTAAAVGLTAWLTDPRRAAEARLGAPQRAPHRWVPLACAATGLLLMLWPLASQSPDGYEAAALSSGMTELISQDAEVVAQTGWLNLQSLRLQDQLLQRFDGWLGHGAGQAAGSVLLAALLPALALGLLHAAAGGRAPRPA